MRGLCQVAHKTIQIPQRSRSQRPFDPLLMTLLGQLPLRKAFSEHADGLVTIGIGREDIGAGRAEDWKTVVRAGDGHGT